MGERWHQASYYKMHLVGVPCGQAGVAAHCTTADAAAVTCGGCRNTNTFKAAAQHRTKCLLHALVAEAKPRPTILTFHGETGEDGVPNDGTWAPFEYFSEEHKADLCPAPTPEALP